MNSLPITMCENIENDQIKIIWLDEIFADLEKSINASLRLSSMTNHLKTFYNIEQCTNYVLNTDVEYIFLIITLHSFSLSDIDLVQKANSLSNITFIYILSSMEISADQFVSLSKVHHISENEEDLVRQLHIDIRHCTEHLLLNFSLLEVGKSTQNLSKESGKFLWQQYYLETLFQTFDLEQAKTEMIEYCRHFYINDEVEVEKICDFEKNYRSAEAIKWYTRDSFLFRLLNKSLRSENIADIYHFRFILSELYTQLIELHCEYLETIIDWGLMPYMLTVYRGQLIAPRELDRLRENIGSLIAMNTFLSTSLNRNVSLMFAGDGGRRPNFESVLFIINIDTNTYKTAFADIGNSSWNRSEQEVLITIGAIFEIIQVEREDNIWIVKLQACNPEYIQKLQEHHYPKPLDQCDCKQAFYFGMYSFFTTMGDLKNSANYMRDLFESIDLDSRLIHLEIKKLTTFDQDVIKVREEILQSTTDPEIQFEVLLEIAKLFLEDKCIIKALEYIKKSQELLFQKNNPVRPLRLARLHKTIALLWSSQGKYEEALDLSKVILIIFKGHLPATAVQIGDIYEDIGTTYFHLGNYSHAIQYFDHSIDIYTKSLPREHIVIGNCYLQKGMTYFRQCNDLEAKRCFDTAFEIYEKNRSRINPVRIGKIYHCQGHLYGSAKYNNEAMCAYEKAEQIYKSLLPSDHPFFAGLYSDMGDILNGKNNLDLALDYLNRALQIELNTESDREVCLLGTIYHHLGENYFLQGLYFASLSNLEKASKIFQQCLPRHNYTYHNILHYMAQAYDKLNMHTKALFSYQQLFDLKVPYEIDEFINIFFSIGRLFVKTQQPKEAIENLQTSLRFNLRDKNVLLPNLLLRTYRYLGLAFSNLQEYAHAFDQFEHAFNLCKTAEDLISTRKVLNTFCHIDEDLKLNFSSTDSTSEMLLNSIPKCQLALGSSYLNVGLAHFRLYEYEDSLTLLHKCLKVFEYLGDRANTAKAVEYIGLSYYQIGEYDQAELFTLRRLTLLRLLHPNNETLPDFPYAYSRLARIKCEQKCYKEAEELCMIAYNLRTEHLSNDDIRLGVSFQTFGIICNAEGKYGEALEYFEKFHTILLTTKKLDHPYFAYLYENFGSIYYNMAQFHKSLEFYEKSLQLALKKYPLYQRLHSRLKYGIEQIFDHCS